MDKKTKISRSRTPVESAKRDLYDKIDRFLDGDRSKGNVPKEIQLDWEFAREARETLAYLKLIVTNTDTSLDHLQADVTKVLNKLRSITKNQTAYSHGIAVALYELIRSSHSEILSLNDFFIDYVKRYNDPYSIIPITFLHSEGIFEFTESADISGLAYKASHPDKKDLLVNIRDRLYQRSQIDKYNLILVGETGTSKGLIARVVYRMGTRRDKKYREINCAAMPENLIESELFGYMKGAFTGATKDKKGILELVNGGTLLLDELGKMPRQLQAKMLKVLEDDQFYPIGSEEAKALDVHFIATIQPTEVEHIYSDLLFRLEAPNVIVLPPLRERFKLVPLEVLQGSLERAQKRLGDTKGIKISESARAALLDREYPGNYRELENILKYAVLTARREGRQVILAEDVIIEFSLHAGKTPSLELTQDVTDKLKNVKLKEIINYADGQRRIIIETKLKDILRSGNEIKTVLIKEELSDHDYQGFMKKIKNITGKGISDLKKEIR